jgi:beta-lactamase class A
MRRRTFLSSPAAALLASGESLDSIIRKEIGTFDATVFIYAKNLDTGATYGLREAEPVRTASTIKLPILCALFQEVEAGRAKWDETILLREEDKVSGSGVLHEFSAGLRLPLRDIANVMIVVSDNTATNLILDRITADTVNAYLDKINLPVTRSLRKVRGDGTQLKAPSGWSKAGLLEENKKYGLGVSTAKEMVQLLEKLDKGQIVSAQASRQIIAILKRQQFKDAIGRRLNDNDVASKSGSLDALRSDVALVTTPKGKLAIAITVDGLKTIDYSEDNPGLLLIARLTPLLIQGLTAA